MLTKLSIAGALVVMGALSWAPFRPQPGSTRSAGENRAVTEVAVPRRVSAPVPRLNVAHLPPSSEVDESDLVGLQREASQDGFLFREAGSDQVYIVLDGTRLRVTADELTVLEPADGQVRTVPAGVLSFLREVPPDRALYQERDGERVVTFERGQKRWFPSYESLEQHGVDHGQVKVVPRGSLDCFAEGPAMN